jgi:hypothetical protein
MAKGFRSHPGSRADSGPAEMARRPVEPFGQIADLSVLGDCDFQFYGNTAGRIYSAQAVLLFLSSGVNLFACPRVLSMKRVDPPNPRFPMETPLPPRAGFSLEWAPVLEPTGADNLRDARSNPPQSGFYFDRIVHNSVWQKQK